MPASPMTLAQFPDVLDPRFFEIRDGEYELEDDRIARYYNVRTPDQYIMRGSSLTPMSPWTEFGGAVTYDAPDQGYNWNTRFKEWARGIQIERPLVLYDQFDVIESRQRALIRTGLQTRQIEAAKTFTNAFSVTDPGYTHSEGVALCSDNHTTTRSGVSTATGFDNNVTAALSPTALKAAYIQFRRFKDDAGQPIDSHEANLILGPVDLKDRAAEIFGTMLGLDTAEGTKNVLEGRYRFEDWIRLTDVNDWFLIDERAMKDSLFWFDKVKPEFSRVEDFDTIIAKYRGYMIFHRGRSDWRWILGASVS